MAQSYSSGSLVSGTIRPYHSVWIGKTRAAELLGPGSSSRTTTRWTTAVRLSGPAEPPRNRRQRLSSATDARTALGAGPLSPLGARTTEHEPAVARATTI